MEGLCAVSSTSNYRRETCPISCQKIRTPLQAPCRDFPNCLCLVHSWCLEQCFYFYCATKVPFIYKYEKERYCYAHRVLCCIAEPSLCHKQCDRLRRRKLNPPSPPILSLTCSLPCVSLFLFPNIYSAGQTF